MKDQTYRYTVRPDVAQHLRETAGPHGFSMFPKRGGWSEITLDHPARNRALKALRDTTHPRQRSLYERMTREA